MAFLRLLRKPAGFSGIQTEPVGGFPLVLEKGLKENVIKPSPQDRLATALKKVRVWFRRI